MIRFRLPSLFQRSSAPALPEAPAAAAPKGAIEIPGMTPDQRTGVFIDPGQVLALGLKDPREPSFLDRGEPLSHTEVTVLFQNTNEMKFWVPAQDAIDFAWEIYSSYPERFIFALPDSDFLKVASKSRYLLAKGQEIYGETVCDDGFCPWAVDLRFSNAGKIRIYTVERGYHHNNTDYQTLANDLAVVSRSVLIKHAYLGIHKGKPSRKEPPPQSEKPQPFNASAQTLPAVVPAIDDLSNEQP